MPFLDGFTYYAWHGHYLLYGVAVAVCVFICSALTFDKAGRLAAVALTIVVLVKLDAGPGQAAVARFLEVGLGIVVALAVTLLVFSSGTRAGSCTFCLTSFARRLAEAETLALALPILAVLLC